MTSTGSRKIKTTVRHATGKAHWYTAMGARALSIYGVLIRPWKPLNSHKVTQNGYVAVAQKLRCVPKSMFDLYIMLMEMTTSVLT
jgi:hypothetical protein